MMDVCFTVTSTTAVAADLTGKEIMDAIQQRVLQLVAEGHNKKTRADVGGTFGHCDSLVIPTNKKW